MFSHNECMPIEKSHYLAYLQRIMQFVMSLSIPDMCPLDTVDNNIV